VLALAAEWLAVELRTTLRLSVRGGLLRTTVERDIADFSPVCRSAANFTLGRPLLDVQAAFGGGRRREPSPSLKSIDGPHHGHAPGPARPTVVCQKSPELVCGH
jgi:hypothetical protein